VTPDKNHETPDSNHGPATPPGVTEAGRRATGRLSRVHRIGAVVFGLALWAFGILGLVNRLAPFSTRGAPIMGLTSNGLLSVVSLVVGAVLVASAVRGGRTASTVLVVVGAAFVLSGVVNVLLLDTAFNVLAFGLTNVVFSLVAGALLLFLGAYGRFTGRLPGDNPYEQERRSDDGRELAALPTVYPETGDARATAEMAEAERAVARHTATPAQAARLNAISELRSAEARVAGWRAATGEPV